MIAFLPRPKRRRRLAGLTCALAVSAGLLWAIVWRRLQETRIVIWVAAVNQLGVDAEVTDDPWDPSLLGRARNWLKLPIVQVYVWGEPEAKLLLEAPAGEPSPLLLHIDTKKTSDAALQRLAKRFPSAELRGKTAPPPSSGEGFF